MPKSEKMLLKMPNKQPKPQKMKNTVGIKVQKLKFVRRNLPK
jgi:hypothetical protein